MYSTYTLSADTIFIYAYEISGLTYFLVTTSKSKTFSVINAPTGPGLILPAYAGHKQCILGPCL